MTQPANAVGEGVLHAFTIALMAFLTVVDLFGTQAILPALAQVYHVTPAAMGIAVNATTFGMAFAGLAATAFGHRIDRRLGVAGSLLLLAVPTALLGTMPALQLFATLRVLQGLCMATAFALTLAYLGEACSMRAAAGALAAYITGNVASNFAGRLISAGLADHLGLTANFLGFALLNLAGAALALVVLHPTAAAVRPRRSLAAVWRVHLGNPTLRVAFGIGFLILFAFLGVFTYINFALSSPPFGISPMMLGVVYCVFLPSIITTPLAGRVVDRLGWQRGLVGSLVLAAAGLPLLVSPVLAFVLGGLVIVAIGTFLAQAITTGIVGSAATGDRAAASGMYLAAYYFGGLLGTAVLGQVYMRLGWPGCVLGVGAALAGCGALAMMVQGHPATPAS